MEQDHPTLPEPIPFYDDMNITYSKSEGTTRYTFSIDFKYMKQIEAFFGPGYFAHKIPADTFEGVELQTMMQQVDHMNIYGADDLIGIELISYREM